MNNKSNLKPKKIWDSGAEEKSFRILSGLINIVEYSILAHIHLSDIFDFSSVKKEINSLYDTSNCDFYNFHVDFLITNKIGYPAMAIEINGLNHLNDKEVIKHDRIKKFIFELFDVPLVTINISSIPYIEDYSNEYDNHLTQLIKNSLYKYCDRYFFPVYSITGDKYSYIMKDKELCYYNEYNNKSYPRKSIPHLLNKNVFEIIDET